MTRFGENPDIEYDAEAPALEVVSIENDKLLFLQEHEGTDLEATIANAVDTQFFIKSIIASGGHILVMLPDSDTAQEITFEN